MGGWRYRYRYTLLAAVCLLSGFVCSWVCSWVHFCMRVAIRFCLGLVVGVLTLRSSRLWFACCIEVARGGRKLYKRKGLHESTKYDDDMGQRREDSERRARSGRDQGGIRATKEIAFAVVEGQRAFGGLANAAFILLGGDNGREPVVAKVGRRSYVCFSYALSRQELSTFEPPILIFCA